MTFADKLFDALKPAPVADQIKAVEALAEYPKEDECRVCGDKFMAKASVDYCSTQCAREKYRC